MDGNAHFYGFDCSPHPRGWSPTALRKDLVAALLPAPAGMVPRQYPL